MQFAVKLIIVPYISKMSGWDVFTLMVNARHVAGRFWIFEGDVESLGIDDIEIAVEGVTEGTGDFDEKELVRHCESIFDINLSSEPPSWKILIDHEKQV